MFKMNQNLNITSIIKFLIPKKKKDFQQKKPD